MARYRKAYVEDDTINDNEGNDNAPNPDNPDKSWEKRYGDSRRAYTKDVGERDAEIKRLKDELEAAKAAKKEYPRTKEDVAAWLEKYPDVGGIVRTLVLSELDERDGKSSTRVKELEDKINQDKIDREREKATRAILAVHSDFLELIDDETPKGQAFHKWVEQQAGWVQYALYENETEAQPAIDAVDLYKARNKGKDTSSRDAALSVGKSGVHTPKERTEGKFSESQVEAMSDAEYERNQEAIDEARRTGNFIYDLSAPE